MAKGRIITKAELDQHSQEDDYWVAVNGKVYDMTKFKHGGSQLGKWSSFPSLNVTNTLRSNPETRWSRCHSIVQSTA
jgi:hypothetical protein